MLTHRQSAGRLTILVGLSPTATNIEHRTLNQTVPVQRWEFGVEKALVAGKTEM
jgi:hypothetical protein